MPRGIKKTYLITVFVQDLEQYIPRVAMEKACFSVFELHVQVTITYQGIIRLIFSTFVWFAFLPFSRLCASFLCVCVCVEGGNTQQRRGRGEAVRLFPLLTSTSLPIFVPRCVFCVHVGGVWGSCARVWVVARETRRFWWPEFSATRSQNLRGKLEVH